MLTAKIKKEVKDWGYKIESESPLKISDQYETLIGLPAQIKIEEITSESDEELDLSKLKGLKDEDYLLITADVNYADEFDFQEWTTMNVLDFKKFVKSLKKHKEEISWYFGTNEELQFSDGEDLLNQLSFKLISAEEYFVLDKLFGGSFDGGAGVFQHASELDEDFDEDEFPNKSDLKKIDFLKTKGWSIKLVNEDEGKFEFKHSNRDYALSDIQLVEELFLYYKKKR